jgi:hypothetical protein
VTKRSKLQLAILGLATGVAVGIAMLRGLDPGNYQGRDTSAEGWVPPYELLAWTAGWMVGEGMLVWFAIAGPRGLQRWLRCLLAVGPAGFITIALLMTLMHAPGFHLVHLAWSSLVTLILLALLAGSLARTYPRASSTDTHVK